MVSAIIPARNEETSIVRAVESVAAQPEIAEVIVVNDQSTDRTAEILVELAARIPKLKVIDIDALPFGWIGKNYAVAQGAAAAQSDWLLFTDADTYHILGATRRALNDAVDRNAVLVSYSPEQELDSFWERALVPFVYCRLKREIFLRSGERSRTPRSSRQRPVPYGPSRRLRTCRRARGPRRRSPGRRRPRTPHEAVGIQHLFHGSDGYRAHAHVPQLRRHVAGLDKKSLPAPRRHPDRSCSSSCPKSCLGLKPSCFFCCGPRSSAHESRLSGSSPSSCSSRFSDARCATEPTFTRISTRFPSSDTMFPVCRYILRL